MTFPADRELAAIEQEVELLLNLTPTNAATAWDEFRLGGYQAVPRFDYRPLSFDVDVMRKRLEEVDIEDVDEPLVAGLLEGKRREIGGHLTLLQTRDTPAFLETSLELYGGVSDELLDRAVGLLSALAPPAAGGPRVTPHEMRAAAVAEIARYRELDPTFECAVEIRDDVVDLMVSKGRLLIGAMSAVRRERVEPLVHHELGTHVVTYFNATKQPLELLRVGLEGYEETQEGIAVLGEYAVAGLDAERMRLLAARVVAVYRLIGGVAFAEIFDELRTRHGFTEHTAWSVTARVARSGGLTKDAIYLRGLTNVLHHLQRGDDWAPLLVGKIALAHVPLVEQLLERGVLRAPALRPRWLDVGAERLSAIGDDTTLLDLVAR